MLLTATPLFVNLVPEPSFVQSKLCKKPKEKPQHLFGDSFSGLYYSVPWKKRASALILPADKTLPIICVPHSMEESLNTVTVFPPSAWTKETHFM